MAEKESAQDREGGEQAPERRGMSLLAIAAWILLAFALAGLVAYRLVTPFFHGGRTGA